MSAQRGHNWRQLHSAHHQHRKLWVWLLSPTLALADRKAKLIQPEICRSCSHCSRTLAIWKGAHDPAQHQCLSFCARADPRPDGLGAYAKQTCVCLQNTLWMWPVSRFIHRNQSSAANTSARQTIEPLILWERKSATSWVQHLQFLVHGIHSSDAHIAQMQSHSRLEHLFSSH